MTDNELIHKLAKIGYTKLWLNYGVLTVNRLIEQENTFDIGDDQNTEHYRYQAFREYLSHKSQLTDIELDNYLHLTFADVDPVMAGSATVDLFRKIELTDLQFERICKSLVYFGEWTEKVIVRQKLLRRLRTSKLTIELFKECIVYGDVVIQEYLLDLADINQLQELVVNGKNKKIRNVASEKIKNASH